MTLLFLTYYTTTVSEVVTVLEKQLPSVSLTVHGKPHNEAFLRVKPHPTPSKQFLRHIYFTETIKPYKSTGIGTYTGKPNTWGMNGGRGGSKAILSYTISLKPVWAICLE